MDSFFELDIHKPRSVSEVLSKLSLLLHKLPTDEKELITITHSATADMVLEILELYELEFTENVKQTFTRDKIALIVWHATNSIMWFYIKNEGLLPYNEDRKLNVFRKEISKIHEIGKSDRMWRKFLADTDRNSYRSLRRKGRPEIYFHVDRRIFEKEKDYAVGITGPEGRISFYRDLIDWSKKNNISVEKLILYLKDPEKHRGIVLKCYLTPEILGEIEWRQVARLVLEFAVAIKLGSYPSTTFTLYRKLPKENIIPKFWVEGIILFDIINAKPIKVKFQEFRSL